MIQLSLEITSIYIYIYKEQRLERDVLKRIRRTDTHLFNINSNLFNINTSQSKRSSIVYRD